jgi:cytochrome c553
VKPLIWIAPALLIVAAVIFFGADVLNLIRFKQSMDQLAQANTVAGARSLSACVVCHGPQGQSQNGQLPSLAGQPSAYILAQLDAFADGRRRAPAMVSMAANLSPDERRQLAEVLSRTPANQNETPDPDPRLDGQGRQSAATFGCAACHGGDLMGKAAAPRLAGQGEAYLASQLHAFRDGSRNEPAQVMTGVARSLSDGDIQALAHYLAGLRPQTESSKPAMAAKAWW